VDKIRDLIALYTNPPVAAVVFAVHEKPQIQALDRTAPTLPMLPTTPARATNCCSTTTSAFRAAVAALEARRPTRPRPHTARRPRTRPSRDASTLRRRAASPSLIAGALPR
jgi:hypothetical protein